MEAPRIPENEAQRIATLKRSGLLDSPPLERFERLTRLSRVVFNVPFALITLVDEERQWFLSRGGEWHVEQTPRDVSFCGHTILSGEPLIVLDTLADPRFADNPLVTGPPHVRFYAGKALRAADGTHFGTLCLIDRTPRAAFTDGDHTHLADLARLAEQEFLLTQASQSLREGEGDLGEVLRETVSITGVSAVNPLEYERARRRIAALYAASRLMGDPLRAPEDLGPELLAAIGADEGWEYGGLWLMRDGELRLGATWTTPDVPAEAFTEVSGRARFPRGVGLLGRVFDAGEPIWVADVVSAPGFTRAEAAREAAFCGGLIVPLRGAEGALVGAVEFYARRCQPPDEGQIKLHAVLGAQLGRFLEVRASLEAQLLLTAREAEVTRQLAAARELDRLKTDLANAVSHELKTPLTTITGYAELLEDQVGGELTATHATFVRQIRHAVDRLERLVADMQEDARIGAGTFRIEPVPTDFGALVRGVVAGLRPAAERAEVALALEVDAADLAILADGGRIEQVLTNFLTNAIKFSPRGATVAVRAGASGGRVRGEVRDQGEGIEARELPRLFTRFGQLGSGHRRGGLGLGLSIAKSIVEAHGGEVGVESAPGAGTTFWFELPREAGGPAIAAG